VGNLSPSLAKRGKGRFVFHLNSLFIPEKLLSELISHCKEAYPFEACGILAGKGNVVRKLYRMTNIEKSGFSYLMDPKEQFSVMKELRAQGLEMTAIYHSHPASDAFPSPKDIDLAFYEDSFYVIASLVREEPLVKAFEVRNGSVREVEIAVNS